MGQEPPRSLCPAVCKLSPTPHAGLSPPSLPPPYGPGEGGPSLQPSQAQRWPPKEGPAPSAPQVLCGGRGRSRVMGVQRPAHPACEARCGYLFSPSHSRKADGPGGNLYTTEVSPHHQSGPCPLPRGQAAAFCQHTSPHGRSVALWLCLGNRVPGGGAAEPPPGIPEPVVVALGQRKGGFSRVFCTFPLPGLAPLLPCCPASWLLGLFVEPSTKCSVWEAGSEELLIFR